MKMKRAAALFLGAAMILQLTACGNSAAETAEQTKEEPAVTEENVQETETAEETEKAPEEEVVIHYWAQWTENETQAEVLKEAIARFEGNHPGCKVEVNWAGRDVRDILRTSLDSGAEIDIVESGYDQIVSNLGEEYLTDLTQYMADSDFEASISDSMASFAKSFTSDGESWYYIPAQPFVGTLYCNQDILDEAGVTEMPKTWDEFLDCCQKIKDAGYDPLTIDDAYMEAMYGHYLAMMKGVDWVTELMTDKTGEKWDDPAVLQMAEDFAELREKGYFAESVGSNVFPAAQNSELALGTAAMYYNGSWLPNEVAEITGDDFNWGAIFFPAPDGAQYPYTTYSTGCQFYAIPKNSAHPEEALALLEEFTSVETQQALTDRAQCIPVIDGISLPDNLACVGDLLSESTDAFVWCGVNTQDAEIQAAVKGAFAKLIAGDISGAEFVEEVQSQLK